MNIYIYNSSQKKIRGLMKNKFISDVLLMHVNKHVDNVSIMHI